jgi:hypothetical protein
MEQVGGKIGFGHIFGIEGDARHCAVVRTRRRRQPVKSVRDIGQHRFKPGARLGEGVRRLFGLAAGFDRDILGEALSLGQEKVAFGHATSSPAISSFFCSGLRIVSRATPVISRAKRCDVISE